MGIPENHPAIVEAVKRGLILPSPGATTQSAEESDQAGELAGGSFWRVPAGIEFRVGVRTVAEANKRSWRGRSNRTRDARAAVSKLLGPFLRAAADVAEHYHAGGPLDVVLTRLGGKLLDRTVNLPSALKATEDAVALMLGADDGDPRWRCRCEQEPCGLVGVRVRITKGTA